MKILKKKKKKKSSENDQLTGHVKDMNFLTNLLDLIISHEIGHSNISTSLTLNVEVNYYRRT